jgi:aminoglycoside/choline kinase family phosphotransferase
MPPEYEALVILTRQKFPALEHVHCEVDPIVKGGSDRRFYRLTWQPEVHPSMVLMVYTMARRDNPKFVPATHRLAANAIHVPQIYAFDEDRLCVWLEDLGNDDLHSHRNMPWEARRPLYEATLREGAKIHAIQEASLNKADLGVLEPPFDEALYEWEQDYFLVHFVQGHLVRDYKAAEFASAHEALKALRKRLAKEPRCLVHRDFQSQNVLLIRGEAWLVDYQGLRPGLAEYDLASLLFDPYVAFTAQERNELLDYYAGLRGLDGQELRHRFWLCAAQRLMQALGAYGNLSRNQGKPHFKQHIPAAVTSLTHVCERDPALHPLLPLFAP